MQERLEAYLALCHRHGVSLDLVEIERRLARCRQCDPNGTCPKLEFRQWCMLLISEHVEQACELCQKWRP